MELIVIGDVCRVGLAAKLNGRGIVNTNVVGNENASLNVNVSVNVSVKEIGVEIVIRIEIRREAGLSHPTELATYCPVIPRSERGVQFMSPMKKVISNVTGKSQQRPEDLQVADLHIPPALISLV